MISNVNDMSFSKYRLSHGPLKKAVLWGILVAVVGSGLPAAGPHLFAKESDKTPMNEADKRQKLHAIRMQQIPLLKQFLTDKYKGSPHVPNSLFRLGEADYETAKYFLAEGNKQQANLYNQEALASLERLRSEFPTFERLDEALFVLGNAYIESQDMEKAGSVLAEISEKFPKSPILKEASLLLGDYYFGKTQFAKAEAYYQTAAEDPKIQSYVFYKLAWVSMSLGQPARGLQYFEKVLSLRGQAQNSGGDYSREAAREMTFAALEVHKSKGIVAYLQKTLADPELIQVSLQTLAKGLVQRGEHSGASDIYELLQNTYPKSPEMSEWVSAQLKSEEALGRTSNIASLVAKLNASSVNASPEAASKVQAQVFNSAKKFHAEAQKLPEGIEKNRLLDLSIAYYQAFLRGAPSAELAAQVHFYLGEVLYAKAKFAEASAEYEASAQAKSDVQARAGWNWFLTAEKLADGFHYQGKTLQATTTSDEKYLAAATAIQNIPGITIDQKRKASYQSARLLYQLNDLERALPVFQHLAEHYAGSPEGKLSSQLVLDIYNLRKDFKSVAHYAKAYQANADSGTKAELSMLEQKALLKTIQEEEAAANALTADAKLEALLSVARRYSEFGATYPQSSLVDAALWAAVQNFAIVSAERGGKSGAKDETYSSLKASFDLLSSKYASSPFAPKAIELMGKFLSMRRMSAKDLQEFSRYRSIWASQMAKEPADRRGAMAMLVYKLSSESEKKSLLKQFASLPNSEDNREAYAYAELEKVKALRDKIDGISLSSLKTLKKNTEARMDLLDRLQREVTSLVKLQIAIPALDGLKVLGDAYMSMGSAMKAAPIPKGLEGEDLNKYHSIVDEASKDMESKGKEALRLAAEKGKEIDLSSI